MSKRKTQVMSPGRIRELEKQFSTSEAPCGCEFLGQERLSVCATPGHALKRQYLCDVDGCNYEPKHTGGHSK
jgi:hypothetical protein